jgi:TRAP-type C4-dicarboxylate transport system permease small subunit
MLPACIAFIVFSSSLLDLIRGKISSTLLLGIGLIALVSLIPLVYRIFQKRKQKDEVSE